MSQEEKKEQCCPEQSKSCCGSTLKEQVAKVLETLRPMLQADGGDVELVDVDDQGVVQLRLQGACSSCPMAQQTLKMGIERQLKEQVSAVKEVVAVQ